MYFYHSVLASPNAGISKIFDLKIQTSRYCIIDILCWHIRKPTPCVYRYIRSFKLYLRICVYILRICIGIYTKKNLTDKRRVGIKIKKNAADIKKRGMIRLLSTAAFAARTSHIPSYAVSLWHNCRRPLLLLLSAVQIRLSRASIIPYRYHIIYPPLYRLPKKIWYIYAKKNLFAYMRIAYMPRQVAPIINPLPNLMNNYQIRWKITKFDEFGTKMN